MVGSSHIASTWLTLTRNQEKIARAIAHHLVGDVDRRYARSESLGSRVSKTIRQLARLAACLLLRVGCPAREANSHRLLVRQA